MQGTHRGEVDDPLTSSVRAQAPVDPTPPAERVDDENDVNEKSSEERASEEPSSEEPSSDAASGRSGDLRTYQLAEDPASGRHRVRVLPEGEDSAADSGGFEEISRTSSSSSSDDALSETLHGDLPDGPRFIVLENTETGEVHYDRERNLSDDWRAGGRYDQMTIFGNENDAARYADERQEAND